MNNKMIAILGSTVISIGAIGGVAFANNVADNVPKDNQKIEENVNKNNKNYNGRHCHNSSNNGHKNMVKIMKDNGFGDAAKHMQSGNYDEMTDYMNNISDEDYDKMMKIMNENGYNHMGKMMNSSDRKGMIQMHKKTGPMHGRGTKNMM